MSNYRLKIQYDGTNYSGWQIQKNAETVQQKIVDAINIIEKKTVQLTGSGRTDSGVHALGQVANFIIDKELDIYRFSHSLNSILPDDIAITDLEKVKDDFNSRFDAKRRSYIYLISFSKSPFLKKYSYYFHGNLNQQKLNELSSELWGKKDFTSFCRKNTDTKNKICDVYDARWRYSNGMLFFKIEADRFLHGMVRTIVGTLLLAEKNNLGKNYINTIITAKSREEAGEAAPAHGLFLYKVKY